MFKPRSDEEQKVFLAEKARRQFAFEEWVKHFPKNPYKNPDGTYKYLDVAMIWTAWDSACDWIVERKGAKL